MREIIVLTHFYDNRSILIVTSEGAIRRLLVPFKVVCIQPVDTIAPDSSVFVMEVLMGEKDRLIYKINAKLFYHFHFQIVIDT
jgi:hypothetical protein